MADEEEVVCPLPALRKVRHRRQLHNGTRSARTTRRMFSTGPRLTHYWLPHLPLPHTRDPSCRAPLTRDRPQACEPRCADVFKHYLACAIASSRRARVRSSVADSLGRVTHNRRATPRHRRDHTKKTRRRLRALLLRLAQVHRQVRDAAHHAEAQVEFFKYY